MKACLIDRGNEMLGERRDTDILRNNKREGQRKGGKTRYHKTHRHTPKENERERERERKREMIKKGN